MNIVIEPGRYVIAVSGGVDSMVLLHILAQNPDINLTVAHLDHGIREDSKVDRHLVQKIAKQYGLPFVYHQEQLGIDASEETAREARYKFLYTVMDNTKAKAIITAHHKDDVLETAIINMIRGTGRKGLASLQEQPTIKRPLLNITKQEVKNYAQQNNLKWHEDSTNKDVKYIRNYVRHKILPRLSESDRQNLLVHVRNIAKINKEMDEIFINYLHVQPSVNRLDRHQFVQLPHAVARELMASWLRKHGTMFDKKTLERLVTQGKTLKSGKIMDIDKGHTITVKHNYLALNIIDR